jgi:hypothetical protein
VEKPVENRRRSFDRQPIEYRQLCAIATEVLSSDPMIDGAEWKERIKDRVARLGAAAPNPEQLSAAMDATERAHPRPTVAPSPRQAPSDPPPLTQAEAARFLADIRQRVGSRDVIKPMPPARVLDDDAIARRRALAMTLQALGDQVERCTKAEKGEL